MATRLEFPVVLVVLQAPLLLFDARRGGMLVALQLFVLLTSTLGRTASSGLS